MFQISICTEVIRELDFVSQCRFARETGYDGLEIAPFTLSSDPAGLTSAELCRLRTIAFDEGTAVTGLHWLLAAPDGLSITSTDPATIRRTRDFGKVLIDICAELGGTYLVHGSPAQRQIDPGAESEERKRASEYFFEAGEHAHKAGLRYLIEPLSRNDTGLINSVSEALVIISETNCPALGTMIDCYASSQNAEDIIGELSHWVPKGVIEHVHFNDPNRRGPGEGELEFGPITDLLLKSGYSGSSAVEPFDYRPNGVACAARAIGYLRGLIAKHQ